MTLIHQASTLMEYHWWVVLSLRISLELTEFRSSSLGCVVFVAARSTPKGVLDQAGRKSRELLVANLNTEF